MSDTPRTDEQIGRFCISYDNGKAGEKQYQAAVEAWSQMADFARQLERENAKLVEALRAWLPENPADDGTQDAAMRALLAKLGEA